MRAPGWLLAVVLLTGLSRGAEAQVIIPWLWSNCTGGQTTVFTFTALTPQNITVCISNEFYTNHHCGFKIVGPPGTRLNISQVYPSYTEINDNFAIYDGPNATAPLLGTNYGQLCAIGPLAPSNVAYLDYHSYHDDLSTNEMPANFYVNILFTATTLSPAYCNETITKFVPFGGVVNVTEPLQPLFGVNSYNNINKTCLWSLTSPVGGYLRFDLMPHSPARGRIQPGDLVYIYDGATDTSPVLAILTWQPSWDHVLSVTTTGTAALVKFVTIQGTKWGNEGFFFHVESHPRRRCSGVSRFNITQLNQNFTLQVPDMIVGTAAADQYLYEPNLLCDVVITGPAGSILSVVVQGSIGTNDSLYVRGSASPALLTVHGGITGSLVAYTLNNTVVLNFTAGSVDPLQIGARVIVKAVTPGPCAAVTFLNAAVNTSFQTMTPFLPGLTYSDTPVRSCNFTITCAVGSVISLNFRILNMVPGDYITVYDGSLISNFTDAVIAKWGKPVYVSTTTAVRVIYQPAQTFIHGAGFIASLSAIASGTQCPVSVSGNVVVPVTPGVPLARNLDCQMVYTSSAAYYASISITGINFADGVDFITIYDGLTTSSPVFANFTMSTQYASRFVATGTHLLIRIKTGGPVSAALGYPAQMSVAFTCAQQSQFPNYCNTNFTGYFLDPAGQLPYYASLNLGPSGSWGAHIAAPCIFQGSVLDPSTQYLTLRLWGYPNSLCVQPGVNCWIYDGNTTSSPLILSCPGPGCTPPYQQGIPTNDVAFQTVIFNSGSYLVIYQATHYFSTPTFADFVQVDNFVTCATANFGRAADQLYACAVPRTEELYPNDYTFSIGGNLFYATPYPPGQICTRTYTFARTMATITPYFFDLHDGAYVTIYQGNGTTGPVLRSWTSGNGTYDYSQFAAWEAITIVLVTAPVGPGHRPSLGWTVHIHVCEPQVYRCPPMTHLSSDITNDGKAGTVSNWDWTIDANGEDYFNQYYYAGYLPNTQCAWLMTSEYDGPSYIYASLMFSIQDGVDTITLYDGATTSAPILATITQNTYPLLSDVAYSSTGSQMLVIFQAGTTVLPDNGQMGFAVEFSVLRKLNPKYCSGVMQIEGIAGSVLPAYDDDPSDPDPALPLPGGLNCTYVFDPPPGFDYNLLGAPLLAPDDVALIYANDKLVDFYDNSETMGVGGFCGQTITLVLRTSTTMYPSSVTRSFSLNYCLVPSTLDDTCRTQLGLTTIGNILQDLVITPQYLAVTNRTRTTVVTGTLTIAADEFPIGAIINVTDIVSLTSYTGSGKLTISADNMLFQDIYFPSLRAISGCIGDGHGDGDDSFNPAVPTPHAHVQDMTRDVYATLAFAIPRVVSAPNLRILAGININTMAGVGILDLPSAVYMQEINLEDMPDLTTFNAGSVPYFDHLSFCNLPLLDSLLVPKLTGVYTLAWGNVPVLDAQVMLEGLRLCKLCYVSNIGIHKLHMSAYTLVTSYKGNNLLTELSFSGLGTDAIQSPDLTVSGNYLLAKLNMSGIVVMGSVEVDNTRLETISLPKLQKSLNFFSVNANLQLKNLEVPNLKYTGDFTVQASAITSLMLPPGIDIDHCLHLIGNPNLFSVLFCDAKYVGAIRSEQNPRLSCRDMQNETRYLADTSRNGEGYNDDSQCSADIGNFGCQSNVALNVSVETCGYTLACIQRSIDLALSNRNYTVIVPNGTFTGCDSTGLNLHGRIFTLQGAGVDETIIDCQGSGRALSAVAGEAPRTLITDMNFRGGAGDNGGLIVITASSPTFRDCNFTGGVATNAGGAIAITAGAHPLFDGCGIGLSRAATGGGVWVKGASITLLRSTVWGNTATGDAGGLALLATTTTSIIDSSTVRANSALRGGGCYADTGLVIIDSRLSDNSARDFGGAVAAVPDQVLTDYFNITGSVFTRNSAGGGGGLFGYSANFVIDSTSMTGNSAGVNGGGAISATCSQDYRILCDLSAPCDIDVRITRSNLTFNSASGNGGAVLLSNVEGRMSDVTFINNVASSGGGVYATVALLQAERTTWTSNEASEVGGATYCEPFTGTCDIEMSIFSNNRASVAGGAVYFCTAACPVNDTILGVDYTILPPVRLANNYDGNSVVTNGYGVDVATDPTTISWLVPPLTTAVSGQLVTGSTTSILTATVTDAYGQAITKTVGNALTLSLATQDLDGTEADAKWQVSGTQTALATNGQSRFPGAKLSATATQYLSTPFLFVCRITELTTVKLATQITLTPCADGQGRASAGAAVTCDVCVAGTSSTQATDFVCAPCPAGSYAENTGSGACLPCAKDFHAPVAGTVTCLACPTGYSAPEGSAECLGATITTAALAGAIAGVSIGVICLIIIAALCLYRLQRRRTMQKYYLDNDATIRTGQSETPLQLEVKRILLANSTTRVGGGLFSNVYKAKYENRWIALKVVKGDMATNGTAQQEFRREAVALSRLDPHKHPGIISLQFYLQINPMCIGVAYCNGGSLKRAISNNVFDSPAEKTRLATEAAAAFALVHSCDIVHLDIKTDNILLDDENHVIVADFGIAKVLGLNSIDPTIPLEFATGSINSSFNTNSMGSLPTNVSLITKSSAYEAAFTPQYADPLRIMYDLNHDEPYLKRADVFSFAIMMWAIYAGEEPYAGQDPHKVMELLQDAPTTRPPPIPGCPEFYATLMQRAWHPEPTARPTMAEVYEVLASNLTSKYGVPLATGYAFVAPKEAPPPQLAFAPPAPAPAPVRATPTGLPQTGMFAARPPQQQQQPSSAAMATQFMTPDSAYSPMPTIAPAPPPAPAPAPAPAPTSTPAPPMVPRRETNTARPPPAVPRSDSNAPPPVPRKESSPAAPPPPVPRKESTAPPPVPRKESTAPPPVPRKESTSTQPPPPLARKPSNAAASMGSAYNTQYDSVMSSDMGSTSTAAMQSQPGPPPPRPVRNARAGSQAAAPPAGGAPPPAAAPVRPAPAVNAADFGRTRTESMDQRDANLFS